jgi:peptidoglycan/xylan/chitin deacetylase (PgdA/CDA1 family)
MRQRVISLLRHICYRCGALSLIHRWRNRNRLTVVIFHRILPPDDPRWPGADPEWTMSTKLFEQCLDFFKRHYSVIGLDTLLNARARFRFPPRPLLITFDDGWADNAEFAFPALKRAGLPAVLFVAGEAIGRREAFWQERIIAAWRTRRLAITEICKTAAVLGRALPIPPENSDSDACLRAIIAALENWEVAPRNMLLQALPNIEESEEIRPHMLSAQQLRELAAGDVAIGLHGHSHRPLTDLDIVAELSVARDRLSGYLGSEAIGFLDTLSFPHGRYDRVTVDAARNCGIRVMFTSDSLLLPLAGNAVAGELIGRVNLSSAAIIGRQGEFRPDRLATWLMTRPAAFPRPA